MAMILPLLLLLHLLLASAYVVSSRAAPSRIFQDPIKARLQVGVAARRLAATALVSPSGNISCARQISLLPCGDDLDRRILKVLLPATLNYLIVPVVGSIDTYCVGRTRDAVAMAGQGAANQVYNSAFFFFSFLPSVVTPLIAKANAAKNTDALQQRIAEAVCIATATGLVGTLLLTVNPAWALSVVMKADSPARKFAEPYLLVRGFTVLPALLSTVGFAIFRGTLDVVTPLRISLLSNAVNVLLDPVLIFWAGLGVLGAGWATSSADIVSCVLYAIALQQRNLFQGLVASGGVKRALKSLWPMLLGGGTMQLRAAALNTALLSVTRTAQRLSPSAAAAHSVSMQSFYLGSVLSLAMATVASVLVPSLTTTSSSATSKKEQYTQLRGMKSSIDRLLVWGVLLGVLLAALHTMGSSTLLRWFTPLEEVRRLAEGPRKLGALLQLLNCAVWTAEGVQQGHQAFAYMALSTVLGTLAMLYTVLYTGSGGTVEQSLHKIWMGFVVLAVVRLGLTWMHHLALGPVSLPKLRQALRDAQAEEASAQKS